MVRCLLALLVAAAVLSAPNWNDPRFISVRDGINSNPASTWKAAIHTSIPYENEEALRRLCGSKMDATLLRQNAHNVNSFGSAPEAPEPAGQPDGQPAGQPAGQPDGRRLQSIPVNYDLRQQYPNCWSVSYIRNQANCGSCWAVSSLSSLSDRYCILTTKDGYPQQKSFSYEDAIECCSATTCGTGPNQGCNGAYIHAGFAFAQTNGVVTGENYLNFTTCKPYSFNPASYWGQGVAPSCQSSCTNTLLYNTNYYNDKHYIRGYDYLSSYSIAGVVALAQEAIINRGSIIAGYDVYSDFYYYISGVYQHTGFGSYYVGGHAVRVIGWGVDNNIPYWLVANSWGSYWGMNGFFKFLRGANECRFETFMAEGLLN